MFARLILALLLAAFAFPAFASAPCHDAPPPKATAMHHAGHAAPVRDDHATVPHMCIGCIPPASLAARGVTAPLSPAAPPRRIVAAAFDPASGTPPALPPPRSKA
ncbi:hypothetical protein U1872_17125 [Sphingomonas sp. RB3P16]|uniref:hypothetical protein n=1 Tax=Parasphingomonas frigoris TaxID=3096163 RepID=UPI002FC69764